MERMPKSRSVIMKSLSVTLSIILAISLSPWSLAFAQEDSTQLRFGLLSKGDAQALTLQSQDGLSGNSALTLYAQSSLPGQGTKEDPYIISTANDLNSIRDNLSAVYKLVSDIDLSSYQDWEPIGSDSTPFEGVLDGFGHSISNLTVKGNRHFAGLFGCCNGRAEFRNVRMVNASIDIDDPLPFTSSTGQSGACAGALCGYVNGTEISDCEATGHVSLKGCCDAYVGGVAGGPACSVTRCINRASVYVESTKGDYYSIDGDVSCGGVTSDAFTAVECVNYGNVTAHGGCEIRCGGIAGEATYGNYSCTNYGNISATTLKDHYSSSNGADCMAGGIVGWGDCIWGGVNYGNVDVVAYDGGICSAGGVVGWHSHIWDSDGYVGYCANFGSAITAKRFSSDENTPQESQGAAYRVIGRPVNGFTRACYSTPTTTVNSAIPADEIGPDQGHGETISASTLEGMIEAMQKVHNLKTAEVTIDGVDPSSYNLSEYYVRRVFNEGIISKPNLTNVKVTVADGIQGETVTLNYYKPQQYYYRLKLNDSSDAILLEVVGSGGHDFGGTKTIGMNASLTGTNIKDVDVSIIPTQYWTGNPIEPKPNVAFNGSRLKENTDYTLSYENNTNEGLATLWMYGTGDYFGRRSVQYKISRRASSAQVLNGSDSFTQAHLAFINGDVYTARMNSSWAKTISTGLDTTSGRIGEAMYDVLNDTDNIISGKISKVSVFDNPYDPIIADLILAQTDMKQDDFDLKWENKLVGYVSDLEGICKSIGKDDWSNAEYKTYLEKLIEAPGEYAKENPNFYKLCESIFGNAASSSDFNALVNAFGKADDLIGAWNAGRNSVEWVAHCLQYNALVSAYLETSDEFKQSMKDAAIYMALNANGDKFISRAQYGLLYEDAYDKFAKFQTEDRIESLLLEEYLKDGATRLESVFGGTITKNAISYVAVGLGISEAAAPWVFASIAAYKAGWGISEAITDNGTNIDCRKLARAYYFLEDAMLWEVEDDASNLKKEQTYERAAKFDASYTILQDLECGALDNYITYLNAQQCSFLQGILHGFRNFNEWEICIAAAMKVDWELARCHDEASTKKTASSYGIVKVCCPTDVFVYDKFQNAVFSIEDGKVATRTKGFGGCAIGDIKMLVVPDSSEYNISVVATDNGSMSYQASTYNPDGTLENTATFKNVTLKAGDTFAGSVDDTIGLSKDGAELEQTSGESDFVPVSSIKLSKSNVSLNTGEKIAITSTVAPSNASFPEVLWTSSDESIASVDESGTITGLAEGSCSVQCSALDSSQIYETVTVVVSKSSTPSTPTTPSTPSVSKTNIPKASISGLRAKTYTGKALTQSPVVKIGGKTLKSGTDYTVSYKNNKNAGTATVVVTGKGNYTGMKSATFKINKARQPLTAKAKSKSVKAKSLKKKSLAAKKLVAVKKAKGKVTYKNVSKAKKLKKFKVNSKNGTVTIPKGAKKGTYKVKVKVTAKGNVNYKSGSKTVTVKIVVK